MSSMIFLVFALTLIDIVCTGVGVSLGFIHEANPVVAYLFERSIVGTCAGILLVVGALLWVIAAQAKRFPWITYALCFVIFFKVFIALKHVYWIYLTLGP